MSAGMLAAMALAAGCTHAGGTVPVDSPKLMAYKAPDIDDITGIDSSDEEAAPADKPAEKPANPPPASNPAQKPHH